MQRHALVDAPVRGRVGVLRRVEVLRRSGVLVLATFAALATLLLPSPAAARPASASGGSVATTGGLSSAGQLSHAGRRGQRGQQAPHTGAVAGTSSTGTTEVWTHGPIAGQVVSSAGAAHTVVGALPATSLARHSAGLSEAVGTAARRLGSAGSGATSSRAPPTA
jgi:hypothetical protein